jgi:copper transport protein
MFRKRIGLGEDEVEGVRVPRRCRAVAAMMGLLLGWWLLGTLPAAAHALVVGSNPQAGARVAHAPAELRIAFSEPVRPLGQGLSLHGPNGQVRLGPARHPDGRPEVLTATLPALPEGSYLAGWRIVSADDGHLEAGSFAFAVGAGTGPVTSPAPPQLPSGWQVVGRWLEVAGVLLLVGVVTAAMVLWRRPGPIGPGEPGYRTLAVLAAVVGAAGLVWQVVAGAATAGGLGPGAVRAFLAASPALGRRMLVEVALLAASVALVAWSVRRGHRPGLGVLALAVVLVVGLALGAHDAGLSPRWLYVGLESVHLLAVGAWVGGLAVLVVTVRRAEIGAVRRFSRMALWLVLVIAVTGAWQGLAQVHGRAALTGTDYGRVLALKVGVVLVVVGLAAVVRYRLLPRAQAGTPPARLRRLLGVEAAGGAAVVLVAALLANTVPAGEVVAAASAARVRGGPQTQALQAGPLRLHLDLEPGTVGRNLLQVRVTDPQGRLVDGLARISLAVADEAGRASPVTLRAARVAPATYRATTDAFTLPGGWQVEVAGGVPGAPPGLAARFAIAAAPATSGPAPPDPPDALVLGGRAGRSGVLVGLTAFSAGDRLLVVRVRGGLGIPPAVAPRPLRVLDRDRRVLAAQVQPCGDGCTEAFLAIPAATLGPLTVEAVLPNKGTARFGLPLPLPRGGSAAARLRAADRALASSGSFRIHEVLDGGFGTVFRTDYQLQAPNLARWHLRRPDGTSDTVWIGEQRWMREGTGPWKHERAPGLVLRFPARNWSDQERGVVDLGPATWHGTPVEVLAFLDPANGAYHRVWVDRANRILHERMDAPGHFMDRDYTAYGVAVTITAPR